MKSTILLIDGDQFIFKATAALEREIKWDTHNHILYSNREECWDLFNEMVERIFDRFKSREHALCFSKDPNFRKALDPSYKGHRQSRKPLCYHEIRERAESSFNCIDMPGLEADDVMGILATKPNAQSKIIISQDKDMKTIPASVWDGKDLMTVTEREADYWHLYQTLVGDSSDGYPGCKGIGPKTAEKILNGSLEEPRHRGEELSKMWAAVVAAYANACLTEDDAIKQARLARILRWTDWDKDERKPILWRPNIEQHS